MASFLQRLGRGAGQALDVMGNAWLDQQKQDRLEMMKKEEWSFRAGEGEKDRSARASQADLDRKSREKVAGMRGGRGSGKNADKGFEKIETLDDGRVYGKRMTKDGWKEYIWDPETNEYTEAGKGLPKEASPDDAPADLWKEGQSYADGFASWKPFSDEDDFAMFDEGDRSEDLVARVYSDAMTRARKIGKEDEYREMFKGKAGLKNLADYHKAQKARGQKTEPTTTPEPKKELTEPTTTPEPKKELKTTPKEQAKPTREKYSKNDSISGLMSKVTKNAFASVVDRKSAEKQKQDEVMREWREIAVNMTDAEKQLWIQENLTYIKDDKLRKQILA